MLTSEVAKTRWWSQCILGLVQLVVVIIFMMINVKYYIKRLNITLNSLNKF